MEHGQLPHAGMLIDEVLRRWPRTMRVLISRRMLCIGCPFGVYHTVAEAGRAHGIDEETFLGELLEAAGARDDVTCAAGSPPPASARAGPSQSPSDVPR